MSSAWSRSTGSSASVDHVCAQADNATGRLVFADPRKPSQGPPHHGRIPGRSFGPAACAWSRWSSRPTTRRPPSTCFTSLLADALAPLESRVCFELLFVNNGSTDNTPEVLADLRRKDPRVEVITLCRNFGYQAAITAGPALARGDAVACIDADGEDPPSVLASFVEKWLEGADIVYGIRGKRPESALMQLARKAYYRVTRAGRPRDRARHGRVRPARSPRPQRRAVDPLDLPLRARAGGLRRLPPGGHPLRPGGAPRGRSHYNLVRAFKFGLGGILSSSTFPLRLLAYGAALFVPVCLLAVIVALFGLGQPPWPGWAGARSGWPWPAAG